MKQLDLDKKKKHGPLYWINKPEYYSDLGGYSIEIIVELLKAHYMCLVVPAYQDDLFVKYLRVIA